MSSAKPTVPASGAKITISGGKLQVPDRPIVPFIEGDGTGPDIWRAAVRVLDAAVAKAYGGKRQIQWMEVYAGQKSFDRLQTWLPDETIDAFREYLVGIKGPLTTPIGGGIRSLNVALRQILDLYVCLRPVRWFQGVPSPVKHPEKVNMVIFRENTEDIYAGIEFAAGTDEGRKVAAFLKENFPAQYKKLRFPETTSFGVKPISKGGSERLIRSAIQYAIANKSKSVTFVHKGNIMKFTEGAFRNYGYALAESEFKAQTYTWDQWERTKKEKGEAAANAEQKEALAGGKILVKDAITDITLQQVLTRPDEFDVIATMNLNGDYLSDALAAQVGGIGIAPGGNINYTTGHAIFEATHGTAPKYTNLDKVNPGSVVLSGEMMLRYMGWNEAADLVLKGMDGAIAARTVTYDFARQMEGATEVTCSGFGDAIIKHMGKWDDEGPRPRRHGHRRLAGRAGASRPRRGRLRPHARPEKASPSGREGRRRRPARPRHGAVGVRRHGRRLPAQRRQRDRVPRRADGRQRRAPRRREEDRLPVRARRGQGAASPPLRGEDPRRGGDQGLRNPVHDPPAEQLLPERHLVQGRHARVRRLSAAVRRRRPVARGRPRHRGGRRDRPHDGRGERRDGQPRRTGRS